MYVNDKAIQFFPEFDGYVFVISDQWSACLQTRMHNRLDTRYTQSESDLIKNIGYCDKSTSFTHTQRARNMMIL